MKKMKFTLIVLLLSTIGLTNSAFAQNGSDGSNQNTSADTNPGGDNDHGKWGLLGLLGLAGLLGLKKNNDHSHVQNHNNPNTNR